MRRKPTVETLEERALMAGLPYGAAPEDTGEFMLGRIAVTPVFVESNGQIDPSTENWTPDQKASVLSKIESGLDWWRQLLAKKTTQHTLEFVIDRTYVDVPFQSGYEPISRRSDDYSLWVSEFLVGSGFSQNALLEENARAFNNSQRLKLNTDWSFSIFVVNSQNDADGAFAANGSFSRAFSFAGGLFEVVPSTRPVSTFTHETGHMFWARDEYNGGANYYQRRGYYDTQNTNAIDANPNSSFVQVDSIMSDAESLQRAFANITTADATLAHLGWQDFDGDGIFDVLDVPLELRGQGRLDIAKGEYSFQGTARAKALPNLNSSGNQNDITLNKVGRIEYRINGGSWITALSPDVYEVSLNLKIPVPSGTVGAIEIRAVESKLGIFSNLFTGPLTGSFGSTESGGISGYVWNDLNKDGIWQSNEAGVAGTTVRLLDSSGQPARTTTIIRSSELPQGLLAGPINGVTISSVGQEADGRISIQPDSNNVSGGKLFQPYMWSASGFRPFFRGQDTQLKLTIAKGTNSVAANVIGAQANAIARIDGYNASGKLVARSESTKLADRERALVTIASPLDPITSVVIYGRMDSMISIEQVSYGLPSQIVTGTTGNYQFPGIPTGSYTIEIVPPDSGYQMVQPNNGKQSVNVSSLAGTVLNDFSLQKQVSPWQNQIQREDVDNDQLITAIDVLVLINEINRNGARELVITDGASPPYWDVNGDRILEAIDVLIVINYINAHLSGGGGAGEGSGGEGEANPAASWVDFDHVFADSDFGADLITSRRRRG
ncbi:MAG: hypothetical protein FJ308_12475 [Planctomycetes bacterium]|nr:hypothetical protein [Planctomycetota bacterium]